jgi:electron transfer flavoprotein alpha subunit
MPRLLLVAFEPVDAEMGAAFAQKLGLPFDILSLTGTAPRDLGAEKVVTIGLNEIPPADGAAANLSSIALLGHYTHIAAVSSMRSKDILGRVAGLLNAAMVTDVIAVESISVFRRPIVAGAVIATVEVLVEPVVLTVRPAGFGKPNRGGESALDSIEVFTSSKAKVTAQSARGGSRPDLAQAKIVVSGGRPLRDAETFERVIGGFADQLGAAVGATRAAVDSGIAANELQVGQTGKIVAPDLYIAAGISGSTQHMAGIKDSKVIVAINKDPDAPIFEFADYGLVADLYDALPAIQAKLKE